MSKWKIIDFKYVELDVSSNIKTLVDDYELIRSKIKKGKIEDLTHSSTEELSIAISKSTEAILEGSLVSREFLLKPNYINKIFYSEGIKASESDLMLYIVSRVKPFHGLTIGEIYNEMQLPVLRLKIKKMPLLINY